MYKLRFLTPIGFLAVVAGGGAVVMLLWNWLMPAIFGLITISFWQALGILVLCRLLFGSFGFGRRGLAGIAHGMYERNPIHEKWSKMTPEEQKEFLKSRHFGRGFKERFGYDIFQDDKSEKQD